MKFLLLAALVAVALAQPLDISERDLEEWESFKVKYMKTYEAKEEAKRMKIFAGHLKFIHEHNAKYEQGLETYTVGINKFSDLTTHEFVSQMNRAKRTTERKGKKFHPSNDGATTSRVDWRQKGAVTPIKDQGQCGSCWAFSTTGSLEAQWFLTNGTLISLSEQNLVDCSTGSYGCESGWIDSSFEYIEDNGGIYSEASYPYTGQDSYCHKKSMHYAATVSGYVDLPEGSESALKTAVTNVGPISVFFDASVSSFQHYKSGIFQSSNCSRTDLDHCALVVGYGSSWFQPYWLVKNSWGTDWGLSGYYMLARNKDNMCGIATAASYPTTTGKL